MWMSPHGREMTKNKPQIAGEKISNLLDDWINLPAVNAFKVAILKQRHHRARGAGDVILIVDGVLKAYNFRTQHFFSKILPEPSRVCNYGFNV